jgi:hypothetical protein
MQAISEDPQIDRDEQNDSGVGGNQLNKIGRFKQYSR